MRPVNLIPPDERRGEAAPTRAGSGSYIVVGVLAAVLAAVVGVVLAGNSVDDKKSELSALEAEQAEVEARAEALASFANFQQIKDTREETIASLAQTRFDWSRVMEELSRVLPDTVWLVNLTGTVSPEVSVPESADVALRGEIPGPALALVGCARSQRDVAALISAVGDIDGVTRVSAERSEKPTNEVQAGGEGGTESISDDCRTRNFITQFQLAAAFDEVAAPEVGAPAAPAPAVPADATPTSSDSGAAAAGELSAQEAEQKDNVKSATDKADKAAGLIGAGEGG